MRYSTLGRTCGAAVIALSCALMATVMAAGAEDIPLYTGAAPRVEDVKQGQLGSCYFHASLAAIVADHPGLIQKLIKRSPDESFVVTFPDKTAETVSLEDVDYSLKNGYDRSSGIWVAVMLRAYAQRGLRAALLQSIGTVGLPDFLLSPIRSVVESSDLPVAYDRAIRSEVAQNGSIDAKALKRALSANLKASAASVPEFIQDRLVLLLDDDDFFAALQEFTRENGEIFGAYRAVGNGGIPARVFAAVLGRDAEVLVQPSASAALDLLRRAGDAHRPMVAGTQFEDLKKLGDWYVPGHAFTVLSFNSETRTVTLRNPWASRPSPDGVFSIPVETFFQAFSSIAAGRL